MVSGSPEGGWSTGLLALPDQGKGPGGESKQSILPQGRSVQASEGKSAGLSLCTHPFLWVLAKLLRSSAV